MCRHDNIKLLTALVLGAAPLSLMGNGMRLASQDGFATARGEAFTATADNPSAIYYNPAGIAQLQGNNLRGGLYGIYLDPTYRPPRGAANQGTTYHSSDQLAGVPEFFYAGKLKDAPWSFGLGIYAPFGGSMDWPEDTGFRAVAMKSVLTYITLNPVVALKLAPSVSIGAGVMANYANMELEQGLRPFPTPPNYFHFGGDGWSVGYNLGLLWRPCESLSFGASFRSAATVTLTGHTEFEQQPLIQPTRLPAQADFTFPLTAVFGVSYRPTSNWNLEFDADYTDWSTFGTTVIQQRAEPPPPVQRNILVTLDWQPSWMYEFGVTRYFGANWHASAGYAYNENSVPNAYYTPLAADLDRHLFSLGAGYTGKRFNWDLACQFAYGPAHQVTGSTPSSTPGLFAGQTADGTYEFTSLAILVSAGVHF